MTKLINPIFTPSLALCKNLRFFILMIKINFFEGNTVDDRVILTQFHVNFIFETLGIDSSVVGKLDWRLIHQRGDFPLDSNVRHKLLHF